MRRAHVARRCGFMKKADAYQQKQPLQPSFGRAREMLALVVVALGVLVGLSGCDNNISAPATTPRKGVSAIRRVGSTYENIHLNRDGTYDRTLIDPWGRAYKEHGTWRGYGAASPGGGGMDSHVEINDYSDPREAVSGSPNVSKSTRSLALKDFYMMR